jgi:carbamoyltransferase
MIIVGLSPIVHNSAASVLVDGELVAAAAEERFSRVKNQSGFPHRALEFVLKQAGVEACDVDAVAYAALPFGAERLKDFGGYAANLFYVTRAGGSRLPRLRHVANNTRSFFIRTELPEWGKSQRRIAEALREHELDDKLTFVDHHRAHCASAYYASGFDRCLALSLDGYGSGQAGAFYLCERGRLKLLCEIPYPHSLGTFYRRVTQALGFKANQHEGKIVGLAAFGDPERLRGEVGKRFDLTHADYFRLPTGQDPLFERELAARHSREDVAAAYQRVLEDVVSEYVGRWVARLGVTDVACAGGVFANVKMNQRIAALPGLEQVFVFPAMGDDGVGAGAAYALHAELKGLEPRRLEHVYLGPGYSEREMEQALARSGLPFRRSGDVERELAGLLAEERVVARFAGRMEFGPRALGNRSILYPATEPEVNQWLNQRLNRTEFMPFAPVTLAEHAAELYQNVGVVGHASEFMTVTSDCTARMKRESPAAVHVDGTARPQLVRADTNPSLHGVLSAYRERTGIPTLINTSFNMHEEPIVCSPDDAIRAFSQGGLEVLSLGPFIAELPAEARREPRAAE